MLTTTIETLKAIVPLECLPALHKLRIHTLLDLLHYSPALMSLTTRALSVLEQTQDGFVLAEVDMQLRGTGEVLGTAQAGLPKFVLADLINDAGVLEQARKAAEMVIQRSDRLQCWQKLMVEMHRRDRHKLDHRSVLN